MQSARRPAPALLLPAAALAVTGGSIFLWRAVTWPAAVSPDAWAYAAWGQALAGGERPWFDVSETTPKPLATLLGAVVAPLPAERAFAVVVALALGVLAAALFAAAHREGGAVAAVVATGALVAAAQLTPALAFAYVDAVVAALVLTAIAVRGRPRIGALVLAGLLRPEAWPLAALAGFTETRGGWPRRLGGALVAGACAPAIWVVVDLALTGDPLGTLNWRSERHVEQSLGSAPWLEIPGVFLTALRAEGGIVLAVAGSIGLLLHLAGVRRRGSADPLPVVVVVVWSLLLALETRYGTELNHRYLLPVVAVLALGCGYLVSAWIPDRMQLRVPWPAVVAVAAGVIVVGVATMDIEASEPRSIPRNEAVAAMGPTIDAVSSCGRLGIAGGRVARATLPMLAASSRRSMHDFGLYPDERQFAAVVGVRRTMRARFPALPPRERRQAPLGPLAVAPGCSELG